MSSSDADEPGPATAAQLDDPRLGASTLATGACQGGELATAEQRADALIAGICDGAARVRAASGAVRRTASQHRLAVVTLAAQAKRTRSDPAMPAVRDPTRG